MKIQWMGHACFCITTQAGLKLITDPYEPGFRNIVHYGPINESADIVTVSHDHGDHSWLSSVGGSPTVMKGPGKKSASGIEFKGIPVYHDRVNGSERGNNTIFMFTLDGITVAHLGDLGHPLSTEQLENLKGTDVLLAPTGGPIATLELQEAIDLWEKLQPKVVIPMHFKTAKCTFPIYGPDDLIRLRPAARKTGATEVSFTRENLPKPTQILILDPLR